LSKILRQFFGRVGAFLRLLEAGDLVRRGLQRNGAIEITHVAIGRRVGRASRRTPGTRSVASMLGQQRMRAHQQDDSTRQQQQSIQDRSTASMVTPEHASQVKSP
jgi:hypothetical protein